MVGVQDCQPRRASEVGCRCVRGSSDELLIQINGTTDPYHCNSSQIAVYLTNIKYENPMTLNCTVAEVMSTKMQTLHPKDTLSTARQLFDDYDIHHLPVHVMGEVKGIISLGDLLFLQGLPQHSFDKFLKEKIFSTTTVDEVMTARPYTVDADEQLSAALHIMIGKRVNALPVKSDGELVGLLTSYDLLKYLQEKVDA